MITVLVYEGLGNQLFQYALGRHLSIKFNTPLRLLVTKPKKKNCNQINHRFFNLDIFNINANIQHESGIHKIYRRIVSNKRFKKMGILTDDTIYEKHFHFDETMLKIASTKNTILLHGYWQSPLYFSSIESILRKDLTFKNAIQEESQEIKRKIEKTISICVHVRRGDFLQTNKNGTGGAKAIHNTVGELPSYFINTMAMMKKKIGDNIHFFVFSDEIRWCIKNIRTSDPITFVDDSHAGNGGSNHFQLMKNCKHFIISNSTFSWWAAWLGEFNDKIVIAPKKWFNDPTMDTSTLIPSEWFRV